MSAVPDSAPALAPPPISPAQAGPLAQRYRHFVRRRLLLLAALLAVLCASVVADIALGPSTFAFGDVLRGLFAPGALPQAQQVILWEVRLPYAVMAVLVGASLGLAGAEMQTALNNPLASPFTLGVSAAAAVGASAAVVSGFTLLAWGENLAVPLCAFVGAACATALIQLLAWRQGATVDTVVLFGIALLFSCNALLGLLQYRSSEVQLQQIVFWMMGSLGRSTWPKIGIAAAVLGLAGPLLWRLRWQLTAIRMGDERAMALGVDVRWLRLWVLALVSLLAATAVSFVGVIGFIGLVGPHIARLLVGEDQRFFALLSTIAGAALLSAASILSKTIVPGTIFPLGIITALIGVPVFVTLVLSRRRGL